MKFDAERTRSTGRAASTGVIPGDVAISVGNPNIALPEGWVWRPIAEVARLESGHTPSRRHPEYWGGSIPWIGIRDATENHGRTISSTAQQTNELGIENSSARVLPTHTVCLSRTASVGYVIVMGRPMATSQDFVNWVCGPQLDYRYLKYALLAERNSFLRFAHGSTHQTIYFPEVKAFHIAFPPRDLQSRIADVLSSLDDRIEHQRALAANLEGIARTLFKSWFVDFDPVRAKAAGEAPSGLTPDLATLFPDRFVDSEFGEIPVGWSVKTIGDAFELNPRRSLSKGTLAPYLDMASTPTKGHVPDQIISREFASGSKFINGDTLLARITPCLENDKAAFVDFLADGRVGWGSTEFIVMRPKPPLPAYFGYLLARHPPFKAHAVSSMSGTSGRQRVQNDSLAIWELVVPSAPVAEAFGAVVEPLREAIAYASNEIGVLAQIRDLLLPRLISGKLRVEDAEQALEAA